MGSRNSPCNLLAITVKLIICVVIYLLVAKQNMEKKWLSWLLIAIAALLVVGGIMWVRYGNTLLYKNVFVDAEKHVSFAYPNNRIVMTGATSPYLVATVTSPDIGEYTPSFNVTREGVPSDMSLDLYVSQTMKQLR